MKVLDGPEWRLLNSLARLEHCITDSFFPRTRGRLQLKNKTRKVDIELRHFLFEQLQILAEVEFRDDETCGDSVKEAIDQLPTLCRLLNSQVNRDILGSPTNNGATYGKLVALVDLLSSLPSREARYGLVSYSKKTTDRPIGSLFLMVQENTVEKTVKCLENLNWFITGLKNIPAADETSNAAAIAVAKVAGNKNLSTHSHFLRKVVAAFHAIFSGFSKCNDPQHETHGLLFHLPDLDEIETAPAEDLRYTLEMFLTYPSIGWQEANVKLIEVLKEGEYRTPPLCKAIGNATELGTRLLFHVAHDTRSNDYAECIAVIPRTEKCTKQMFQSFPGDTLWSLLADGRFRRSEDIELGSPDFVTWTERRSLAIRLIVGILISLENHHVVEVWDSAKVYILDTQYDKRYVSCSVLEKTNHGIPLLPNIPESANELLDPSPALTILAKTLLEICYGPLAHIKVDLSVGFKNGWRQLNKVVNQAIERAKDLQILPFLEAARCCLDFHIEYEKNLTLAVQQAKRQTRDDAHVNFVEIAKDTFSRHVMQKFMTTELSPFDATVEESVISLFDDSEDWGKGSREAYWAEKFFMDFKGFRDSYEPLANISNYPQPGVRNERPARVAIIDTGVNKWHSGLRAIKFENGHCWSWVHNSDDITDNDGHGTYCAHFLHKIAPKAEIFVAQAFGGKKFNMKEAKNIPKAIYHAVDTWGVDIISMSFGLQEPSSGSDRSDWEAIVAKIRNAVSYAASKHVLLFAAASNRGKTHPRTFPATMEEVICIHAFDGNVNDGGINPEPEDDDANFATLGIALESPRSNGSGSVYKSGTSFATAIAAGTAAVLLDLARRKTWLHSDVKSGLRTFKGIRKMFREVSKQAGASGRYRFIAPWILWEENWQVDQGKRIKTKSKIDDIFKKLARVVEFPNDTIPSHSR